MAMFQRGGLSALLLLASSGMLLFVLVCLLPFCLRSDFGVEDKLLGYAERATTSSLTGSIPGSWGKLQKLRLL
jgi:hypothetical protein